MTARNILTRNTLKCYCECLVDMAGSSLIYHIDKAFTSHLSKADDEVWWQVRLTQSIISELAESLIDGQAVPTIPCPTTLQIVTEILDSIANVAHVASYFTEGFNARRALLAAIVMEQASKAVTDTVELALMRWKFLKYLLSKFPSKSTLATVFGRIYEEIRASNDVEFACFIALENLNQDRHFEAELIAAMTNENYSPMFSSEVIP